MKSFKKFVILSLLLFIAGIFTSACGSSGGGSSSTGIRFFSVANNNTETNNTETNNNPTNNTPEPSIDNSENTNNSKKITFSKNQFSINIGETDNIIVYVDGEDKTREVIFTLLKETTKKSETKKEKEEEDQDLVYERVKKSSDKCKVTIEYKDSDSGEVIKKQVIKGSQGSSYSSAKDSTLDVEYDYVDVEGSPAGKFTTEPQKVTYLYKKFTGEIFTLTVKYLQEGNKQLMMADTELSKPVTMRIRSGEDYTAPIKQIPGMKLDTSVFPINAVGRAVYDMEVNYYYIPSDQTDLVLHYYNSHGFGKVYAYVTASGTDGETILSAELPGSEMKADSELGIGWYSLTISGKGSLTGVTVKFSDTSGPGTDDQVYSVGGEVWIKNGEVIRTGELNIIYIQNGTILGCDTQTGRVGEEYATVGKEFENLRVSGSTTNTTGTFTEAPIYVIYRYEEMQLVEKPMMKVVIALGISSLLTLAAAAALGFAYRRKKRNM